MENDTITIANWPYRSLQPDANFPFIMGLHPVSSYAPKQDEQIKAASPEDKKRINNWLKSKSPDSKGYKRSPYFDDDEP